MLHTAVLRGQANQGSASEQLQLDKNLPHHPNIAKKCFVS